MYNNMYFDKPLHKLFIFFSDTTATICTVKAIYTSLSLYKAWLEARYVAQ
jgi:hypothetical protein